MKYLIKTYGCLMNHSDSERIAGVLELANYELASEEKNADLVVLNMCSVRESAVNRISGNFHKYKKYKKKNLNFKTVITGCVLENDKERFEKLFDIVIDIKEIEQLPERLNNCHSKLNPEFFLEEDLDIPNLPKVSLVEKVRLGGQKKKILNQVQDDNTQVQDDNAQVQNDNTHAWDDDISSHSEWSDSGTKNPDTMQKKFISFEKNKIDNIGDYFSIKPQRPSKTTASVPIMTGCNNFCSYCVVPYTRGREKSRAVEEILSEIKNLVKNGYKEIILLGQNVNSYESGIRNQELYFSTQKSLKDKSNPTNWIPASTGMTNDNKMKEIINFPKLLRLINTISGDFWIRFMTSHPKDISEELIKTIAQSEKCANHIHLALQSGDNYILEKMNRRYTAEHFLNIVDMIRKYIPAISITTDIIVGFPGETEEQFQNTVKVMTEAKFDMAYINKYSPRTGTVSAKMDDSVSWKEKRQREVILTAVLKRTALENNEKYIGKIVDIIVEKVEDNFIYGKSRSNKDVKARLKVNEQKSEIRVGDFVKIKIIKTNPWNLEGN